MFPRIENCRGSNSSCPLSLKNVKAVTLNVRGIALKNGRKFPISYARKLEEAEMVFEMMSREYDFIPNLEHYVCMIDLLSRVGCIDKAIVLIKYMPVIDNLAMLITILNGCRRSGNVEVGRMAFGDASQMDGKDGGVYVCMSNIYASCAVQEEAWNGGVI